MQMVQNDEVLAGVLYVVDVAIKTALVSQGIKFPGPLVSRGLATQAAQQTREGVDWLQSRKSNVKQDCFLRTAGIKTGPVHPDWRWRQCTHPLHAPCCPQVGMFGVVALLLVVGEDLASKTLAWFGPCLNWIAKWLPLFYVASLVTLPLNLSGISGARRR